MLPAPIARGVVPPGHFVLRTLDPFRGLRDTRMVVVGTTLGDALDPDGSEERNVEYVRAFVDDLLVSGWPGWRGIRPLAGSTVSVCWVPGIPLWIVIVILLVISIAAAIANLVLVLTAKQADRDQASRFDSPTLRGLRNRAAPHEPIPRIYGRYRFQPPLGAYAYTEVIGVDHFIRGLFVVGYGPLVMDVADMRIGETPLTEFDDVEIEVRPGELTDAPVTLYPGQVTQEDLNVTLHDPGMDPDDVVPGEALGSTGPQIRNTDENTDEVGLEFLLPGGVGNLSTKGLKQPIYLGWEISYRKVGTTPWILVPQTDLRVTSMAFVDGPGKVRVYGFRMGTVPIGINFKVPERAEYEVRVRATEPNWINAGASNTIVSESRWFALKSFRNEAPFTKKGIALIAIRIKASDQLQGTIDDFSVIARAKLPTWNGTAWTVPVETRNAAWAYADVLRGSANPDPVPDALIDADRIKEWADANEAHTVPDAGGTPVLNPMYFDGVFDFRSTVYRTLSDVAAVARGSPHMRDGKFSVSVDHDRSAETPVQMITPRNIIRGSYVGRKVFFEEAHAYRIGFKNELKDYGDDEVVVFTTGYTAANARIYEKVEWLGIVDSARAVDEMRFMIAARRYRPEVHAFEMDVEHIVFERGDLVLFAHDAPLLGLAYGRIRSLLTAPGVVTGFELDEKVVFQPGVSYGARVRRHQAVLEVLDSVPISNPATTLDVETTTLMLTFSILTAEAPEVGDLVTFGEMGIEARRCVVRQITPGNDMTAGIELEDEGAAIFGDLTQPMPPFDPGINLPPDLAPHPPTILEITSDFVDLFVTMQLRSGYGRAAARCEAQVRTSGDPPGQWLDFPPVPAAGLVTMRLTSLELDRYYDVRVRTVGANGLASAWTQSDRPFFHASHPTDVDSYQISDLALENILDDPTQFVGPSISFRWQIALVDGADEDPLSQETRALTIVHEHEIIRFDGYFVRVYEAVPDAFGQYVKGDLVHEELIPNARFVYDYDHNVDDGGPRRAVWFEVAAQLGGLRTLPASHLAVNPTPALPDLISISGVLGSWISINLASGAADADWEGFLVWRSATAGFSPGSSTLVFKGRLDRVLNIPADPQTTYYVRYASFDRFTDDPAALSISDEQAITTSAIPGSVDEIVASVVERYQGPTYNLGAVYPATTPSNFDSPTPWAAADATPGTLVHQVQFEALYEGLIQIRWEVGTYLYRISNDLVAFGTDIRLYYSVGASPVGAASQLPLRKHRGTDADPSTGDSPIMAWGHPWPPGPTNPSAFYHDLFTILEAVPGTTYWIYAWVHAYGWPNAPQEHHVVHDMLTIQQVI